MTTRDLRDAVVVVTGATSGIGRTAALMFGAKGARLVLAARRRDVLEEVAASARRGGPRRALDRGDARGDRPVVEAVAVPTDVVSRAEVERLADVAVETFGRIDVWVNAAAVAAYGRFEDIPELDFRQVLETDLLGCVHGCQAALPVMRRQHQGTIINVASMLSRLPAPYASPYVVAKSGIRALSGCLRSELLDEPAIHVCTVHPGTVGTPLFGHAANYSGRELRALPPVVAVERVARTVVRLAERPRRDVAVGVVARLAMAQSLLLPRITERALARYVGRRHFAERPAEPTRGNLYDPLGPEPTDGEPDVPRPGDTAEGSPGSPGSAGSPGSPGSRPDAPVDGGGRSHIAAVAHPPA